MMNIPDKFLPLGSVVMLKNGKHRAMIIGYGAKIAEDDTATVYDYIGCLFPEGVFTTDESMVFNHTEIKTIYYMGLVDEEVNQFHARLKEVINKMVN